MARWGTKHPPKKKGRYLVTVDTPPFGRQVRQADRYLTHYGEWAWSILPAGGSSGIVAWQKCPEPYKGE